MGGPASDQIVPSRTSSLPTALTSGTDSQQVARPRQPAPCCFRAAWSSVGDIEVTQGQQGKRFVLTIPPSMILILFDLKNCGLPEVLPLVNSRLCCFVLLFEGRRKKLTSLCKCGRARSQLTMTSSSPAAVQPGQVMPLSGTHFDIYKMKD